MGNEFSKRAVIRVIMDAMAGLDSLKDIYDKVEAMEEPNQQQQFCSPHSYRSQIGIDELINKYVDRQGRAERTEKEVLSHPYSKGYVRGAMRARMEVIKDLEQLKPTKPELVEVPEFVADWYEEHKRDLNYSIWKYVYDFDEHKKEDEFYKWMNNITNEPLETLIRMKDGYTVKKEQLYWAVMGVTDYFKCDGKIIVFTKEEEAVEVANLIGINTRAEQLENHKYSDCVLIDELRGVMEGK